MKPILIDALHINMSGALMILNHLVDKLTGRNINFVLLKDQRCPRLRSEVNVPKVYTLSSDTATRKNFYKSHADDFHCVLCLGNVPPLIKLDVPVHTYIHNVSLLSIPKEYSIKWKIKAFLKHKYISFFAKNTDTWIVQTENTKNLVKDSLPCKGKDIHIYPFYHIPQDINHSSHSSRHDYIFVGEDTYAKGHADLIEAWRKLSHKGFHKKLHLTTNSRPLIEKIDNANSEGANIENHGFIEFSEVVRLYNQSKAIVYPSLNESLGLGIIEAINAGCDVIGCDLPYMHCVCMPSELFRPSDPDSIVDAILKYDSGNSSKTIPRITDMADRLIDFLLTH